MTKKEDIISAEIAEAIAALTRQIYTSSERLGLGEATSDMGALEALGFEVKEGSERIASALFAVAAAIEEHNHS